MIEITRAGNSLEEALRLQLQAFPEEERSSRIRQLLDSEQKQIVSVDDCLVCRQGERLAGVQLLVSQPDGTVYVWPAETRSGLHPDDDASIRRRLYEEAARVVDTPGVWIGQSLLETDQEEQSRELSEHGFPRLTDLVFMNRPVAPSADHVAADDDSPDAVWHSEPFDEAVNAADFAAVVELTYQSTCDCPELNGTRDGWESLESHRQAGSHSANRWRLFRHEERPAGLLLLTEHPPESVWEVVYFGVAPEFRGMGFGKRILEAGLDLAHKNGIGEIVLAVDVRNSPAIRLYEQLNFSQFDRRIVHARLRKKREGGKR
jgi:ribosomal protein S18 acetylase RimI-like enzyme